MGKIILPAANSRQAAKTGRKRADIAVRKIKTATTTISLPGPIAQNTPCCEFCMSIQMFFPCQFKRSLIRSQVLVPKRIRLYRDITAQPAHHKNRTLPFSGKRLDILNGTAEGLDGTIGHAVKNAPAGNPVPFPRPYRRPVSPKRRYHGYPPPLRRNARTEPARRSQCRRDRPP